MSNRRDGIRVYWDGRKFITAQGQELHTPIWFHQGLPNFPLDCDLWHSSLEKLMSIIRSQKDWKEVKLLVRDMPQSMETFERRQDVLKEYFFPDHVGIIQVERCSGFDHLDAFININLEKGSKGVILIQPESHYQSGKVFHIKVIMSCPILKGKATLGR